MEQSVCVLSAATQSHVDHDASELNINRSSIQRHRQKHRTDASVALKEELQELLALIVHWDGKLMQDLTTKENLGR